MKSKVKVKISGKNPILFIQECIRQKINIYDMEKEKKNAYIIVEEKELPKLQKIKTSYQIQLIRWYGYSHWKRVLKKYWIFLLFGGLGVFSNIFFSFFIFQVEVVHPNKEIVNLLQKDLEEMGISKYHFQVSYQKKEKIKEQILEKEKEKIEWLEIEKVGTKYIIQVEERKKEEKSSPCLPRHIVAKKKAILLEIQASSGEIQKKKNDYVEKGDIVISGLVYNKEEIVNQKCAIGSIYGEVWYRIVVNVPKEEEEKKKTGKEKYGIFFQLGKKKQEIGKKYESYEEVKYPLIEDFIIPLSFGVIKYEETTKTKKINSFQKIEKIAFKEAEKELKKQLEDGAVILSKKVLKKRQNDSKIEVTVFCKVKENITEYLDISSIHIEERE